MNLDQTIVQVHLEDIIPNRFQPRLNFDEEGLKELADSIKEHGIIQPLVLRRLGDKFEIIAGERRYKAASLAGLTTVPAVISNVDDNKAAEVAIVENVQRRNLTAIEEARSYKNLLDKGYLTQESLAKKMGLSQPAIANKLRLLNLDDEVQQALLDEKISERHARTLLSIPDKAMQREWLHRIINERLTVRQLDTELKKLNINTDDTNDEDEGGVPSVPSRPSVEEIKENAHDLFENKSVEDKMKPTENDNQIETLDTEEFDHFQNNTFIESPSSTTNLDGTFNPIEEKNTDNKYFNFNSSNENTYISPTNNIESKEDTFEIIDDNPEQEEIPQSEENPFATEEEKIKPVNLEDNDISTEFTISANNKFFTPIREDAPKIIEEKKKIENPMDRVNKLSPSYQQELKEQQGNSLKDSIGIVRKSIDELGRRGVYAEIEEIDFNDFYQITIKIAKDDN